MIPFVLHRRHPPVRKHEKQQQQQNQRQQQHRPSKIWEPSSPKNTEYHFHPTMTRIQYNSREDLYPNRFKLHERKHIFSSCTYHPPNPKNKVPIPLLSKVCSVLKFSASPTNHRGNARNNNNRKMIRDLFRFGRHDFLRLRLRLHSNGSRFDRIRNLFCWLPIPLRYVYSFVLLFWYFSTASSLSYFLDG